MKLCTIGLILAAAGSTVAASSPDPRDMLTTALASIRRDPTGAGFAHLGSDNVLRSFDGHMNVVDELALDASAAAPSLPPGDTLLEEARTAWSRSRDQVTRRRRGVSAVLGVRQDSCVSENCMEDAFCQGLTMYGYNCTSCLMITSGIGNCLA